MRNRLRRRNGEALLVEDAALSWVFGQPILEALPSREVSYEAVDPFILLHEGRVRVEDVANVDTKHAHRDADNLWYVLEGSASRATAPARTAR